MSSTALEQISYRLQNPINESERLVALGELREYRIEYPEDREALDLWTKYRNLGRDWTKETVSTS